MARVRVELNISGFDELRNHPAVAADLLARGEAIARACGPGYRAELRPGAKRAHVTVWPDTIPAREDEAEGNLLLRNLDAGR